MTTRTYLVEIETRDTSIIPTRDAVRIVLTHQDSWFTHDQVKRVEEFVAPGTWIDDRHILYAGWVAGLAMRNGLIVHVCSDNDGNVTPELIVHLPTAESEDHTFGVRLIIPPPPDHWNFA